MGGAKNKINEKLDENKCCILLYATCQHMTGFKFRGVYFRDDLVFSVSFYCLQKSDLAKMETMVNVSGGDWSRKNRHGSLMTVEQIVKLEEARQGLYRKLNKSSRFKSLYGEEDTLSRSFGQSNCEYIENGVPGSASLKHGESRKLNGEIMTRNHSFKAPSVNNNYMQNGFSSDDSELPTGPPPRVVIVERKSNGDFDLVLREVTVLRRGMGKTQKQERSVVLIESRSPLSPSIFIPGDRVIEVNDTQVEDMACSEVWNWINRSENKVRLKVQPIPELNELSMRTGVNGEKFSVQEQCIQTGTLKRTGSRRYLWGKVSILSSPIVLYPIALYCIKFCCIEF